VEIEFDPAKDAANIAKHGVSLAAFAGFDAPPAIVEDNRRDYGEVRWRAFGRIDGVGHPLVYTEVGSVTRLISFRRAHEKEMRCYE